MYGSHFWVCLVEQTVMCLLVTRYPRSDYVSHALGCLDSMHALFQSASSSNHVARKNLVRNFPYLFLNLFNDSLGYDHTVTLHRPRRYRHFTCLRTAWRVAYVRREASSAFIISRRRPSPTSDLWAYGATYTPHPARQAHPRLTASMRIQHTGLDVCWGGG